MARISASRPRSQTISVAAPVGGWNARDSYGDMGQLDAVSLTNWFPNTNTVMVRSGYTQHVTGISGQVETLMAYSSGTANAMFGSVGTSIYNVTTAGAVGAASLTGKTNARWQYINFTTSAGSYLLAVNNADKMISWDGAAWHKDGDGSPYNVSNVDTATCANIHMFKHYIWLIPTGSLKVWYLPIDSIGGAAAGLDMSSLAQMGGYIMAAATWTIDAGYGVDDYLVFITSNGEVIVWRLTDPSAPTGIAVIGVYQIGSPIGRRCCVKYAGDLLIITQDGVVPLSGALQSSRLNPRVSITDKIQYATSTAITNYGSNFGWQLIAFPKGNQLYLNVPVTEGNFQQQYVQNNITKAWCNFTGWYANCWETLNDNLYFGSNGYVGHAWNGTKDNTSSITATALQSFQAYGGALQKRVHSVRYHLLTDGSPQVFGNVNTDYDINDNSGQLTTTAPSYGLWDSGLWDVSTWGAGVVPSANWDTATGIGATFAPFLKAACNGVQLQWAATDMIFETGGAF